MARHLTQTGKQTDPNDLLYLWARYYAPGTGVFTALDPFEGSASRPMSLNGYLYVEGDPVNKVDPSEMQACSFGYMPDGEGGCMPTPIESSRELAETLNNGFCTNEASSNPVAITVPQGRNVPSAGSGLKG